jgi:acid phosphatase (class A)
MFDLFHQARRVLAAAGVLALGAAGAAAEEAAPAPDFKPGALHGYLANDALPDSARLLPSPPGVGTAAAALDQAVARASFSLRDTARWRLAAMDADLSFPHAAGDFACALGVPVAEQDAPRLINLLRRVMADAGTATFAAKDKYRHARPFMLDEAAICSPDEEPALRQQGSYPSGHASVGWAWALVLAEAAPERVEALIARGLAFGESRLICNVHWRSDVEAGRVIAAATVARLHAEPAFSADLAAAKGEIAALRAKKLPPQRDCVFEAKALSQKIPSAP